MKPALKSGVNIVYSVDKIINCDIGVNWLITLGGGELTMGIKSQVKKSS